jgi:hypothetical protein
MRRFIGLGTLAFAVAAGASSVGCVAGDSGAGSGTVAGCDAITADKIDDTLDVDPTVRVFLQASVDFRAVARKAKAAAKSSCVNIATDLGVTDTWTALGDGDDTIANQAGTGACDAATARIRQIMEASGAANANFALVTSPGACRVDFTAQAACDAKCKASATCDSGTVETRCAPGQVARVCDEKCKSTSFCEGKVERPANCMGACESTCTGQCAGTCTDKDGKKTTNNPSCHGKCSSACNGTCAGSCKVDVDVTCGTSVRCKGECTTTYTAPVCESEYTAPTCTVDASCEASCSASVSATTVCDPPHVELYADVTISADVAKLVTTLNANLPQLLAIAEQQGKLAVDVAQKLVKTGETVVGGAASLGSKSIVCSAAGAKASVEAALSLSISVKASADLTTTCRSHSS